LAAAAELLAASEKKSLQLGLWPASGPAVQASKAHHSNEIDILPFPFISFRPAPAEVQPQARRLGYAFKSA
jgi:hypothetical protein